MEIVINRCYGGFSLSKEGTEMYLKLKGKECYTYTNKEPYNFKSNTYVKSGKESFLSSHYITKDLGEETDKLPNEYYFSSRDIPRDDKDLVKVVKELGNKANGRCAELSVVEIPDNTEWTIEEYDGYEHIAEKHRTWG